MSKIAGQKSLRELLLKNYFDNDSKKTNNLLADINRFCDFKKNPKRPYKPVWDTLDKIFYDPNAAEQGKNANFYRWVTFLYLIYDIPMRCFELPEDDLFRLKVKSLNLRRSKMHTLKPFNDLNTGERMKDEYYEVSKQFLDNINESLYIYDYLERFKDETDIKKEKYVKAHSKIFEEIENKLKNKDGRNPKLQYARFLVLPLTQSRQRKGSFEPRTTKKEVRYQIISLMSVPLFQHICDCLLEYECFRQKDLTPEDIKTYKGGFYIVPHPSKAYTFAYGDSGNICMTEHYRYNKFFKAKADLLFINKGLEETNQISVEYRKEIELYFSKCEKLLLSDIKKVMQQYENVLREDRNENLIILNNKIQDLSTQLNKIELDLENKKDEIDDYRDSLQAKKDKIYALEKEERQLENKFKTLQNGLHKNKFILRKSIIKNKKLTFFNQNVKPVLKTINKGV